MSTVEERFAQKVREEIGEETNPLYVAEVLKMNVPELLLWLQDQQLALGPTIQESLYYAEIYQAQENRGDSGNLRLGTEILHKHFKLIVFILKEIKSRVEAIDV